MLTDVAVDRISVIVVRVNARHVIDKHTSARPWSTYIMHIADKTAEPSKTVVHRGSRSDQPRYLITNDHTRWTLPLPLAYVPLRRTPRRATAQLMT